MGQREMMKPGMHKILVVNPTQDILPSLLQHKEAKNYTFEIAKDGPECLEKVLSFHPDLILMDLLLPRMHGIDILHKIKSDPKTKKIGVIIASDEKMIQNYRAAVSNGVDYFLHKPCEIASIYTLFQKFFKGGLTPDPFTPSTSALHQNGALYTPSPLLPHSYLKFWGTRGSCAVSGPEYIRHGGNTCCLEIRMGEELIVIDAGTGIRPLGTILAHSSQKTINLFLSHTHWDHITGLPFFTPLYDPSFHIVIWAPVGFEKTLHELFTTMLTYAYFPVRLEDIQAKITFKTLHSDESLTINHMKIESHYANHPGETHCFKVRVGKTTFGYVTDNEILMGYHGDPQDIQKNDPRLSPHQGLITFFQGCDFLIHEAQFTPLQYQEKVGWGHSSISNAAVLIKYCNIKKWYITHHDPEDTDKELENKLLIHNQILQDMKLDCAVEMVFDGHILPL